MKVLKYTSQFKKDLKRIQNNPKRIDGLKKVLKLLQEAKTLPKEHKPHMLAGNHFVWAHTRNYLVKLSWHT